MTILCSPAAPAAGQRPVPELDATVLTDVGLIPAPGECGCVSSPFRSMRAPSLESGPLVPEKGPRQRAEDAERRAKVARALRNPSAVDADASFDVAMEFTHGDAVGRNDKQALTWFLRAARQGNRDAFVQLGHRYHRGKGVRKSDEWAVYWFHAAAASDDPMGMVALGRLYAAGRGVDQNWPAAVWWWQQSAGRRDEVWQLLGDAHACGLGVDRDFQAALAAYKTGRGKGDAGSRLRMGGLYESGCGGPADDEGALVEYESLAAAGYPEGDLALSRLLLQGRGRAPNPSRAYVLARLAEARLPKGDLRRLASTRAAEARRLLSREDAFHAERMVRGLTDDGTRH